MMKNMQEPQEITFYCDMQITEAMNYWEMISITQHFGILNNLELSAIGIEGGCEIITLVQYVLQPILCSYN